MCGRITLTSSGTELASHFELVPGAIGAEVRDGLVPRYNIAPSQEVATVRENADGDRVLSFERWGLVPHWAKDPAIGNRLINARCETLGSKPAFRDAVRKRRCIIPADGFYEWSGSGAERFPYLFRREDRELLGLAGLYERWIGEGGEVVDSFTIVTTDANTTMRAFHDRMPVILPPELYGRWLDREQEDLHTLGAMLVPCADDLLATSPVSTRINSPRNDDAACWVPEPRTGNLFG